MDAIQIMKRSKAQLVMQSGDLGRNARFAVERLSRELKRLEDEETEKRQLLVAALLMVSTGNKEDAMAAIAEAIKVIDKSQDVHEFVSDIADMLALERFTEAVDLINLWVQKRFKQ